ncbi:MAG TPA: class I SAM-dependent methyltransferase [Myxococcaceae bacterium]|nr:class I SAM-dependent methyltransferase [Myxococcaceae bacterium]
MSASDPFENRLRKNARHWRKWARAQGLTAYRLYDRDMPEWPFTVDWYDGRVQLVEYPTRRAVGDPRSAERRALAAAAVQRVLEIPPERLYVKTRRPMVWGEEQYERRAPRPDPFVVEEQGLRFEVDLAAHLDTGLFLDHRLTRARVRDEATRTRFLNLFCYTGAFTVYAAAGGARETVSVDLSNTYLDWAERNLRLNGLWERRHELVRSDVLRWLDDAVARQQRFDLVVLDPPSFSTSKKMARSLDVQRDQHRLLGRAAEILSPGGTLYFSTHFKQFELNARGLPKLTLEEITTQTLPPDFRQGDAHRCWRIRRIARGTERADRREE